MNKMGPDTEYAGKISIMMIWYGTPSWTMGISHLRTSPYSVHAGRLLQDDDDDDVFRVKLNFFVPSMHHAANHVRSLRTP